ncbi:hypothetical protein DMB91_06065 [Campylobacter sp. MIT 97-5078]|nr:hypothetical protein LR59_07890 [Campylobacter sp. MIT 97-5078]KGI57536.1 hypothetical protein LR59_02255 [Campylobacter sp. MIT 97-5078]KGI57767.1 hypothetical protein LR59_03565 [Campylobacter sp. MIT 97-5078]TQR26942.1 hypothetical protein DMB91_06065 [Campylobacter sp. MIT 97-5078]
MLKIINTYKSIFFCVFLFFTFFLNGLLWLFLKPYNEKVLLFASHCLQSTLFLLGITRFFKSRKHRK